MYWQKTVLDLLYKPFDCLRTAGTGCMPNQGQAWRTSIRHANLSPDRSMRTTDLGGTESDRAITFRRQARREAAPSPALASGASSDSLPALASAALGRRARRPRRTPRGPRRPGRRRGGGRRRKVAAAALGEARLLPPAGLERHPGADHVRRGGPASSTPSQCCPASATLRRTTAGSLRWLMTRSIRPSLSRSPRAAPRPLCGSWK